MAVATISLIGVIAAAVLITLALVRSPEETETARSADVPRGGEPAAPPAPAAAPAQPQAAVAAPTETPKAEVDLQAIREARAQRRLELLGLPEPEPAQVPADLEAKVDEYIAAAAKRGSFSGSILIAQGDKILMSKGYGMADYENGIPNTPQTKFNLGNITRQFTAMAVVQLQEKGLLHVDDPVSKYLPDYPNGDQITLHHLLVTTAGIPSYAWGPEFAEISQTPTTVEELISLFRDKPLDFVVGTNVNWSASGYVLLGYVIEQVSGMSYEAYIQENIFGPLDMSDSGYDINRPGVTQRAYGYLNTGTSPVREASMDMSNAYAAAGLYSTAEDLYKWDRALQTEKLVSRESLDSIFTNYFEEERGWQLGYGWLLIPRTSTSLITAGGGRDLVATWSRAVGSGAAAYARIPGDDIAIIELNNSATSLAMLIMADLFSIVTGLDYELREERVEREYDAEYLDQYTGRFERIFDSQWTLNLNMEFSNFGAKSPFMRVTQRDDGGLSVEFEGSSFPKTEIVPENRSDFFAESSDLDIRFAKTDLGGVTGLLIRVNDRDTYRYRRMPLSSVRLPGASMETALAD